MGLHDVKMDTALAAARPYCPAVTMDAEDPLFLLYTSGSGSEGTLGGLVSLADRIEPLVAAALERGRL
jgi:hypothetical protein